MLNLHKTIKNQEWFFKKEGEVAWNAYEQKRAFLLKMSKILRFFDTEIEDESNRCKAQQKYERKGKATAGS